MVDALIMRNTGEFLSPCLYLPLAIFFSGSEEMGRLPTSSIGQSMKYRSLNVSCHCQAIFYPKRANVKHSPRDKLPKLAKLQLS